MYWGNGCQIIPPHDAGIASAIEANLEPWAVDPDLVSEQQLLAHPLVTDPWVAVTSAYYSRLEKLHYLDDKGALAALGTPVYTPLHGVGAEPLLRAFQVGCGSSGACEGRGLLPWGVCSATCGASLGCLQHAALCTGYGSRLPCLLAVDDGRLL